MQGSTEAPPGGVVGKDSLVRMRQDLSWAFSELRHGKTRRQTFRKNSIQKSKNIWLDSRD